MSQVLQGDGARRQASSGPSSHAISHQAPTLKSAQRGCLRTFSCRLGPHSCAAGASLQAGWSIRPVVFAGDRDGEAVWVQKTWQNLGLIALVPSEGKESTPHPAQVSH